MTNHPRIDDQPTAKPVPKRRGHVEANRLLPEDRAAHEWYRFVLSFPPHLVRTYLDRFAITAGHTVLDPFCGTGTTLVECKKLGVASVGIEANPMASFASAVKIDWSVDSAGLATHARAMATRAGVRLDGDGISATTLEPGRLFESQANWGGPLRTLNAEATKLLLDGSISPLPLHKVLVLLNCLDSERGGPFYCCETLGLAKILVDTASNLAFGPEVGVGSAKSDAPVIAAWLNTMLDMAADLDVLGDRAATPGIVHAADARALPELLAPNSVDAVITSPPYPNEKDYTRTTRLESVVLGLVNTRTELRALKQGMIRSNTRGVYKGDDDDLWVADHPEIQRIAGEIEARRVAMGKTSGFERMYARVTRLYFGGMARHLADLRRVLRPGARLAYVVGDQASYLRVLIRTGTILADIAASLGYEVCAVDLFRTRMATATRAQLREEVVVLRWPGGGVDHETDTDCPPGASQVGPTPPAS